MKAWWTIFIFGLLLPCFTVATDEEEFSLVLDLHRGLCMTNNRIASWTQAEPCDPADRSQRWYMRERAIVNSEFGGCLEPAKDNDVRLTDCHGGRSQEWEFDYLRNHLFGEMQWVRYLHNMKCMRFQPGKIVYMDTCADEPERQFLKRKKLKDVASSCLERKCPECPMCSNSSHSDCRCPECVESPDILGNLVWLPLPSHAWLMVPVLVVFCGGWIWKKLGGMEAAILRIESAVTEIAQAPKKKLDAMEAAILHIESTLTEIAAQAPKKKLDAMEATILNIHSIVAEIAAAQICSDSSSVCTVGSWTHVKSGQPCCFLPDTYFKVVMDDGQIFCPAKMLFKGTRVIAADGTAIEVLHPPEQHQVDAVIKLQVGSASLVVSPDHRILIPGKKTIQAKDLEVGSEVLLDGTEAKLTSFEWNHMPTMVMKIAFKPDIPVAAFMCAPSILSKGSRNKPRVRRGTGTRTPEGGDALTMPDTEPPLTP